LLISASMYPIHEASFLFCGVGFFACCTINL
jgi:hypothetical protein